MFGDSASLVHNEILRAFQNDPAISRETKQTLQKLKYNSNRWQDDLKSRWELIEYPQNSQASIFKLNTSMQKQCSAINTIRSNQRSYYLLQNNQNAASLITDVTDHSVTGKSSVIIDDQLTQGWNPVTQQYETICYTKKVDLSDFSQRIDQCQNSGAINTPKSILNLLNDCSNRGFTAENYASLFLQFIQKYLPESYVSSLTYSNDTEQLFTYLISLVNTTHEVSKIREALGQIERKTDESLANAVLKVKSLTNSLLFMLNPSATLEDVDRRSSIQAVDSIFSLVNQQTADHLKGWKRRANEMNRKMSLQETIEAASNFEQMPNGKITSSVCIPDRFSQADLFNSSFFTENGLHPPDRKFERRKSVASTSGSSQSRNSSYDKRNSRPGSRTMRESKDGQRPGYEKGSKDRGQYKKRDNPPRDREDRRRKDGKEDRGRRRSKETRRDENKRSSKDGRRPSKSSKYSNDKQSSKTCAKCGSLSHISKDCIRYPYYYEMKCEHCKFYHPSDQCRFRDSRYRTPEKEKSPVSFASTQSNIFSKN